MTPPIDAKTPLNKVLGINHNISPDILGKAYEVLHEK